MSDTGIEADAGVEAPADVTATDNQPSAAPENSATIAASSPEDAPVTTPADWPEDWRDKLAGGDEKMLNRLKRFTSPQNVINSWREAEKKLSSGDYKKPLPADATPEQAAAWRKENGIPETKDGYKFDLGGIVPGKDDEPALESFKEFAHSSNLPPEMANSLAKWWFGQKEEMAAAQIAADKKFNGDAVEELRAEWGPEYRANVNMMNTFLDSTIGAEGKQNLFGARLADGTLLGDNPGILKWLAQIARDNAPGADIVPTGQYQGGKGITDRIAELEKLQSEDSDTYYNSGAANELMKLYDAREKMQSRAA